MFLDLMLLSILAGCAESPSKTEMAYLLEHHGYKAYQDHRWVDAEEDYRQASSLDPQNLKYRNNLFVILYREGKRGEAENLLELNPIDSSLAGEHILIDLASTLLKEHRYPQAKKVLDKIRLSGNWPAGFRRLMAYADIRTGQYGEAFLLLHEIVQNRPQDPVILGYLSIVYKKEGEKTLAQKNLQRALKLSRSPRFRKSLTLLYKKTANGTNNSP